MGDTDKAGLDAIDHDHDGERDRCTEAQAKEQVVSCLARLNRRKFTGEQPDEVRTLHVDQLSNRQGRESERSSTFPLSARMSGRLQDIGGKYAEHWWMPGLGRFRAHSRAVSRSRTRSLPARSCHLPDSRSSRLWSLTPFRASSTSWRGRISTFRLRALPKLHEDRRSAGRAHYRRGVEAEAVLRQPQSPDSNRPVGSRRSDHTAGHPRFERPRSLAE